MVEMNPPEPGGRVAEGDEEGAYALLQAVRDVGPSGGTMVEFPFEELHKRVAEAIKKARSEGYEARKAEENSLSPEAYAKLDAGIEDARAGRVVSLGSFAQYADDDEAKG